MRCAGFGRAAPKPLFLFDSDAPLKAHPDYRAAKAGDTEAAIRLVRDLGRPLVPMVQAAFPPGALYAAPHAIEASGDNAIPQVLAAALAEAAGGRLDEDIIQANRVFHTGADPMERLIARAQFDGAVEAGADYVLVDDVTTMGGTLADLPDHIQGGGGRIIGVVVMVSASRTGVLGPEPRMVPALERRHGDAIRESFGIFPEALTADEARYLVGFRTADEIRGRRAKAAEERDRRLRAKGLQGLG